MPANVQACCTHGRTRHDQRCALVKIGGGSLMTLSGAGVCAWLASTTAQRRPVWPVWVLVGMFLLGMISYLVGQRLSRATLPTASVTGTDSWLVSHASDPEPMFTGRLTRGTDGQVTECAIRWPDGTPGEYTGRASNATPGAVDSFEVTYRPHGRSVRLVTQPPVTRNVDGAVVERPGLIVS